VSNKKLTDTGLATLLELNGEIFPMDNGFWTKIEARKVVSNEKIPHGVRYCLTLHDQTNLRVLGFDNAHRFKADRKGFGVHKTEWDHKHERNRVKPYTYKNAGQLMEDFWNDVLRIIEDV